MLVQESFPSNIRYQSGIQSIYFSGLNSVGSRVHVCKTFFSSNTSLLGSSGWLAVKQGFYIKPVPPDPHSVQYVLATDRSYSGSSAAAQIFLCMYSSSAPQNKLQWGTALANAEVIFFFFFFKSF